MFLVIIATFSEWKDVIFKTVYFQIQMNTWKHEQLVVQIEQLSYVYVLKKELLYYQQC